MEKEYEFWPDKIAKELVEKWKVKKQVIVTGTSMSGEPHIGNANDVIRGHAIYLALKDLGQKAKLIWISDNVDPLRSIPRDMPSELKDYLGMPVSKIPDIFDGLHKNFANHFEEKFLSQLKKVFIKPKALLGNEMYEKGMYNEVMIAALKRKNEIIEILNKFRKTPLTQDWYPIDVICENCGKIATTRILNCYPEEGKVEYECSEEEILLHRKFPVKGCGYKGERSILNGGAKLTWRVEWPARWVFLKATCEPFGKEHAAAGGSWDTAKEIVKVLGWNPPYPVIYEHFLVNGEKMSKSKGNVITLEDIFQFLRPEHLRYWMFQGRLTIAKNIVLKSMVPNIFNEFAKAERIYFGLETTGNKRKDNNFKRAYKLAKVKVGKRPSFYVEFEKLVEIAKILPKEKELSFTVKKLKEWSIEVPANAKKELALQLQFAKRYYEKFGLVKIEVEVDERTKKAIESLIEAIEKAENGEELQSKIFEIAKVNGIQASEFFKTLYKIILNADSGPRLGQYIFEIGKKTVIDKLREFR
jgi:lysyl-tRNA synthetase class 1